jgi:hypothetical protein
LIEAEINMATKPQPERPSIINAEKSMAPVDERKRPVPAAQQEVKSIHGEAPPAHPVLKGSGVQEEPFLQDEPTNVANKETTKNAPSKQNRPAGPAPGARNELEEKPSYRPTPFKKG